MSIQTQLLDGFLNLAASRNRHFLYDQELFYILDYARISIPENIYLSYGEDPEEKFKMKFHDIDKKYVLRIVSKYIENGSVAGGTAFGASSRNMEDLIAEMKYNFPVNYAKWIIDNRDKATDRYRDVHDKNELITKISYDIKGFLIVEQVYYPKMFGTEFFIELGFNEQQEPLILFGDNTEYSIFKESGKSDNCASFSANNFDKNTLKETIGSLNAVRVVTGQESSGLPHVKIDDILRILAVFLSIAQNYSKLNPSAKWHLTGFSSIPCVSADSRLVPLRAKLTFMQA